MTCEITLDEDKCVGCNKCIAECPVEGANVAYLKNGESKVGVNMEACILCGACVDICDHGARGYLDDIDEFLRALESGEPISVMTAPSIRYNFEDYKKLFGYLKQRGIVNFYDVSLGADMSTWGYLRSAEADKSPSIISQACPSVVAYIERHKPDLIPWLAGSHSPVLCLATYLRKYLKITEKIVLISPCIAKSLEIKDTGDLVNYNVTYRKLKDYLLAQNVDLSAYPEKDFDDIGCGIGLTYPRPGGLRENVEYHTQNRAWVRQVEGTKAGYDYLKEYADRIEQKKDLPFLIDILNCAQGCNLGTGTRKDINVDDVDAKMNALKKQKLAEKEIVRDGKTVYTLFEMFDREFDIDDFRRSYVNRSKPNLKEYSKEQYDEAYERLYKYSERSRHINCFSCGYGSCKAFAKALLSGENHEGNCINYNRDVAKLEKQQVIEQKQKAEAAANAKTDFLANMSHEIRTPMNAVLGMTQLLLDTSLAPEQKNWAQIIYQSGEGLLGLINDILDFTKIDGDHIHLEQVNFNLCSTTAQVTDTLSIKAREKEIELLVSFENDVPHFVIGDPGRYKQILYNLVGNAIKFTEKGHVLVTIEAKTHGDQITLHIEVQDTGLGISEDKLGYIFEKFAQGEESTTRRFGGTGLGLAISKKLVNLMGGDLAVKSQTGAGSTFYYDLRVLKGKEDDIARLPEVSLDSTRALLVDDHKIGREIVGKCLARQGIAAEDASTAAEAMDKIRLAVSSGRPYDFIMLDYRLGDTNGLHFCDTLFASKDLAPFPSVIMVTSHGYVSSLEQLAAHGIAGFLVKPFFPAHVEATLKLVRYGKTNNLHMPVVTRHTVAKLMSDHDDEKTQKIEDSFEKLRVLVVEDLPFNRLFLTKVLGKHKCIIDTAENGEIAVRKFECGKYDIIFMDCQMPEMDGYTAARTIREIEAREGTERTVIVALTADALTADRERCIRSGMDDHLGKPFKQEQITDMIKKWVEMPPAALETL